MEKGVEAEIAEFENECSIDVDWASSEDLMQPAHYVEHWRRVLWENAFRVYFDEKGEFKFTKGLNLMDFQEGPIAIKRVAYRYFSFSLSFFIYSILFSVFLLHSSILISFNFQVHSP